MSNWDFEDLGDFGSDADADRWAKRNRIAPQDVRTRTTASGVRAEIRRSALGDSGIRNDDLRDGRRTGF
ncbi:MAG: hypothetical protein M3Y22_15695 [Pseudomonadota bacterium]|nr:hypothetical protein [Pseudomonadota bacterium]